MSPRFISDLEVNDRAHAKAPPDPMYSGWQHEEASHLKFCAKPQKGVRCQFLPDSSI